MGGKRIRGLKTRVECECTLAEGGQMGQIEHGGIPAGGVRGENHSAGRCGISKKSKNAAGRAAPGVRASKSSESRKKE